MQNVSELKISYTPKVKPSDREKIGNSQDSYKILTPLFADWLEYKEVVWVLYLNQAHKVVGAMKLSEGGIAGTVVDQRILFEGALLCHASKIILSHNHPSGQLQPSQADKEITNKIKEACTIMDFVLLDHLIMSNEGYFSFADEGIL